MRENRTYGSEGGEAKAFPTPINVGPKQPQGNVAMDTLAIFLSFDPE